MNEHGSSLADSAKDYVSWSDARLRGYLRSHGMQPERLPAKRDELLREMRARYTPGGHGIFASIKEGVRQVFGAVSDASGKAEQNAKIASISASSAASAASHAASSASANARDEL